MKDETKNYSLPKEKIKILLLEGLHENALHLFNEHNYSNIEYVKCSLEGNDLVEKIKDAHLIGIRSKTNLTEEILDKAKKLIAVGCYSIGTNQVNLQAAKLRGIPVFNAPFSNTRSVAELVISECIFLIRGIPEKNFAAHIGKWVKDASHSYEVRGKNLGIIGYGHIGSQVSILAEALGMNVFFYDIEKKLNLGNAKVAARLEELLSVSDIVTLHVPETEATKNLISAKELSLMKKGSYLINAARGAVINVDDLAAALERKHLAGAAVDVFPEEPNSNNDPFISPLQKFQNVILTPHIGGSTSEAQANIALEVSEKLIKYCDIGSTIGATNFVEISLTPNVDRQRYLHIHKNQPGVLNKITNVFTSRNLNIASQYLQTDTLIGYVIIDIDSKENSDDILKELRAISETIKTRMLM
ncbi:MAG: D-3-phosphoglycerate dehydrogenase [Ignavibacteria bacterium]|nr:MAG: D-3-phosphoglycerate dehydrogenase [Ignavibacteria bacterium]KAF0160771.1 MAG: D-3-phosphoglycerate dehydrogenase [Ignavibacteria bacterium]